MTAETVSSDTSRGPVGIYPAYCDHDELVCYSLRPSRASWSGLDIRVTNANQDSKTSAQPFTIQGRKLSTSEIKAADGALLYRVKQKWSFRTRFEAKDANDAVVLDMQASKLWKTDMIAVFTNRASASDEKRQFDVKIGFHSSRSEIREGAHLVGLLERPDRIKRMWMFNEPYTVTIAPKVDRSLILAICTAVHAQFVANKSAAASASTSGAAASVSI